MELCYDSLTFYGRMEAAGMPEAQAAAMKEAFANQQASLRQDLATKVDLANTKHEILRWSVGIAIAQTALLVALLGFMVK